MMQLQPHFIWLVETFGPPLILLGILFYACRISARNEAKIKRLETQIEELQRRIVKE